MNLNQRITARENRTSRPLTKKFVDIVTGYFQVHVQRDKISLILAALDKQGINKGLPTYSKYVNQYKTTIVIGDKYKHQFDTYFSIGGDTTYYGTQEDKIGKYIGGEYADTLEKMYLAEASGLLPGEQWSSGRWARENKKNIEYKWYGLSDDGVKEIEERKRHIPSQFIFPAYIFSYMQNRQFMDMFLKRFSTAPNIPESNVADFNMQLPLFVENQARASIKQEKFDNLAEKSKHIHILDSMYRAELSESMKPAIEKALQEEEDAVKEARKQLVKPMGQNIVRENQNNQFGGTRRRRRHRKSTRRHRRN